MPEIGIFPCDKEGNAFSQIKGATIDNFERILMEPGTGTFSFDPLAPGAMELLLVEREVQFWLDGGLRWWGIPRKLRGDMHRLSCECEGLSSHLIDRIVDDGTLTYTSIDQLTIFRNLILFAQSEAQPVPQANRNLNITFPVFALSGHVRSRKYPRDQHGIILELLKEFATLQDGFEWDIQTFADGRREATPYYPRKGSPKPEQELYWQQGGEVRNIKAFSYNEDGTKIGTHGYVTGGSSGDVHFEENYEDVVASARFGVRQFVSAEADQNDVDWLLEKATKMVNERKEPINIPDVTIPRWGADGEDMLDVIEEGDTIPLEIDHGRIQFTGEKRIARLRWNSTDDITLTFVQEDAA